MARLDITTSGLFSEFSNSHCKEISHELLEGEAIAGASNETPHSHSGSKALQRFAEEVPMMPPTIIWLSGMSCGVPALDNLHREVIKGLSDTSTSNDHEFIAKYGILVSKVERTFQQEELWMEEIDFPILRTCQEQHARVLGALHNVHSRVMEGDYSLGREVIDELLPQWFAFHISTMDATLGVAMQMAQAESGQVRVPVTRFDASAPMP